MGYPRYCIVFKIDSARFVLYGSTYIGFYSAFREINNIYLCIFQYIPRPSATANNRQATGIPKAASGATNGTSGSTAASSGGASTGGVRTRNKANRQTVTNLELQAQAQKAVLAEESTMPPPPVPIENGSENIPPRRGQVDVDTVGKAAGGVSK